MKAIAYSELRILRSLGLTLRLTQDSNVMSLNSAKLRIQKDYFVKRGTLIHSDKSGGRLAACQCL